MEETRIYMRKTEDADFAEGKRYTELYFMINHTMPMTEEYNRRISELFYSNIGDGSRVMSPVTVVRRRFGRYQGCRSEHYRGGQSRTVYQADIRI